MSAQAQSSNDHHDRLQRALNDRIDAVLHTADDDGAAPAAQRRLVNCAHDDVLAHLQAEQTVLYPAAREAGLHALVDALEVDHRAALAVIEQMSQTTEAFQVALLGRTLSTLVSLRVDKEEQILLPALHRAGVDTEALADQVVVTMASDHSVRFKYI